jgi:hypothetical protein
LRQAAATRRPWEPQRHGITSVDNGQLGSARLRHASTRAPFATPSRRREGRRCACLGALPDLRDNTLGRETGPVQGHQERAWNVFELSSHRYRWGQERQDDRTLGLFRLSSLVEPTAPRARRAWAGDDDINDHHTIPMKMIVGRRTIPSLVARGILPVFKFCIDVGGAVALRFPFLRLHLLLCSSAHLHTSFVFK